MDDLAEIRYLLITLNHAGGDAEIEENLHEPRENVLKAFMSYLNHAKAVCEARTSRQLLKEITGGYEAKREQLIKPLKRAIKTYKFMYQVSTQEKLIRQQGEMIKLQKMGLENNQPSMPQGIAVHPDSQADTGIASSGESVAPTEETHETHEEDQREDKNQQ